MTKYRHFWQYNGVAQFTDIVEWCDQNNIVIWANMETIYFTNEQDYMWFLLRWA